MREKRTIPVPNGIEQNKKNVVRKTRVTTDPAVILQRIFTNFSNSQTMDGTQRISKRNDDHILKLILPKCRISKVQMILSCRLRAVEKMILAVERRKLPLARRVDKEELYKKNFSIQVPHSKPQPL